MIILGLNTYHGDSSACLVRNGELLAAVEEERLRRIKHWAGFPSEAIRYCLEEAKINVEDIDHIAVNRKASANILKKALFTLRKHPSLHLIKDRLKNAGRVTDIKSKLAEVFGVDPSKLKADIHHVEHHMAHLGSSFFVSPFDKAAVVSVDGFGDFVGTMWGMGEEGEIKVKDRIFFPHSLGLFYLAFTQFLGFPKYGDEFKVMGLAAYGKPIYLDKMRQVVHLDGNGRFKLNLDYFIHHSEGVAMTWNDGEPAMGSVYSKEVESLLGADRHWGDPITSHCKDIAASIQAMYEEAFFHLLNDVYDKTKLPTLCLAGGCAMNSLANGKIFSNTPFRDIYIQPAAGDAGGAIGAAYYVWNQALNKPRSFVLDKPYLGPRFTDLEIKKVLDDHKVQLEGEGCRIEKYENANRLCRITAGYIAEGKVIGWFQGRMEWGPRALGNRSIVCDPRRSDMKEILNSKIKRRESFRPFAPSIHLEAIREFFEIGYPDPFMLKVYKIKAEKRDLIPAVTHVDGTGRLQTVSKEVNPLYWQLIDEFKKITGVPVVLNTSFNENEPIVCTPKEALDCFLRTKMDVLVLGNYLIKRSNG